MEKQGFISGIPASRASSPYICLKFSALITRVMRNLQLPAPVRGRGATAQYTEPDPDEGADGAPLKAAASCDAAFTSSDVSTPTATNVAPWAR